MAPADTETTGTVDIQATSVPVIGLGTWDLRGEECVESVADALSIGYRHIDTAQMYENEAQVGEGIGRSGVARDAIFLTTKIDPSNVAPPKVRASFEESLSKLATDHVNLLLIHWPSRDVPVERTLEVMRQLRDEGKVRHIGVSNFTPTQVEEARRHAEIFCNQVEYHPYLSQAKLAAQARDLGYLLTAYCPVAKGRVLDDATLRDIGAAHGKSPAQVALRWLIQQANVAAIPKAASAEHRRANLDVFDFALTDEELARIHALGGEERLIDPDWAPDWER